MIAMAPPRPSQNGSSRPGPAIPAQPGQPLPATGPVLRDRRFPLQPGLQAAAQARAQLRQVVRVWGLGVDVDVLVLLTTELVANAVLHTGDRAAAISLCVRWRAGALRVEVHDGSGELPLPAPLGVDDGSESGRGLMLVDALAAEWGYYRVPGGKVVYFTLPVVAGQQAITGLTRTWGRRAVAPGGPPPPPNSHDEEVRVGNPASAGTVPHAVPQTVRQPRWITSSVSRANGACVEVASLPGGVGVRDSRDRSGPVLRVTPGEWHAFLGGVRGGGLDRLTGQAGSAS